MKKIINLICSVSFVVITFIFCAPINSMANGIPDSFPTMYHCNEAMVIDGTVTFEDETINKNIYVSKNSTLITKGTVTFNGDIYLFGTLSNHGFININKTLYCLNYMYSMNAGDYDYGYFFNYGNGHIHILGVTDKYLPFGIPTIVHDFDDWETIIKETCTIPGYSSRTCRICGEIETRIDQNYMNGHEYGDWYVVKPASCGITGTKERKCIRGDSTQTAIIPALSHNFTDWTISSDPTYISDGMKFRKCLNCGIVEEEKITKLKAISISKASISKIKQQTYTGKSISPKFTVKLSGKTLKKNIDYYVKYKNNKRPGRAIVNIVGKGKYNGTKTVYFNIAPRKTQITTAKNLKSGSITLKYKKCSYVSGYQISYSTNRSFKKAKNIYVKGTTKIISKLINGKTYFIKVRPYKSSGKLKIFGSYSTVKRVTITNNKNK